MTTAPDRANPARRGSLIATIAGGLATLRSVILEEVLVARSRAAGESDPTGWFSPRR